MHSLPPSILRPLSPEPVSVPSAALTAPVGPKPPTLCRESNVYPACHGLARQVLPYSSLAQELATRGSGPVVVLTAGKREADVAAQVIVNQGRHAAWGLFRDRTSAFTVPMLAVIG